MDGREEEEELSGSCEQKYGLRRNTNEFPFAWFGGLSASVSRLINLARYNGKTMRHVCSVVRDEDR